MKWKPPLEPQTKSNARDLRQAMTVPEALLWGKLRAGRLAGLKFRRQHPIKGFIVDFYCHERRLVIELDGNSHIGTGEYDLRREDVLRGEGLRVIRFGNDDVIQDLDGVLAQILFACGLHP